MEKYIDFYMATPKEKFILLTISEFLFSSTQTRECQ